MKRLFIIPLVFLFLLFFMEKCANPQPPQGGPQDTIPPKILSISPPNKSVHFKSRIISITLDEAVNLNSFRKNLIITPTFKSKYKLQPKKRGVVLKFENNFEDSTTYTLNLSNCISDATEGNAIENFTYVFSTGDFLDSISISGKVTELLTNLPEESMTIGLYFLTDTLDIFQEKPTYFSFSKKNGDFSIQNIKTDSYRLVAFQDENKNLLLDAASEKYAFLATILQLNSKKDSIALKSVKMDASQLKVISARPIAQHFVIRLTKEIDNLTINPNLPYIIEKDKKSITLYKPDNLNITDSLFTILQVEDELGNQITDSLYVQFTNKGKSKKKFEIAQISKALLNKNLDTLTFEFSKPVYHFDSSAITLMLDSLTEYSGDTLKHFIWNKNKSLLKIPFQIDKEKYFSFQKNIYEKDTAQNKREFTPNRTIQILFPINTFLSADEDSLERYETAYTFKDFTNTGTLILNIKTNYKNFSLDLLNADYQSLGKYEGKEKMILKNLPPSKYGFRFLIDENNDGQWDLGNILKFKPAEPVYIHPEFTQLRSDWEISLDIEF